MDIPDNESQHSDASNSSDWMTELSDENEPMDDSDSSQCSLFSSKSEQRFVFSLFDALDKNRSKCGLKFLDKLLESNDPKDKETLKSSLIEIVRDDHTADLKYLISKNAIDFFAKDYDGQTLLSLAASLSSTNVVKVLLANMTDSDVNRYNEENLLNIGTLVCLPNLSFVEDTIAIIDLLRNKNFIPSLKNKLAILRFFMHDVEDECECADTKDLSNNMELLITYGTSEHIKDIVTKIKNEILAGNLKKDMFDFGIDISRPLSPGVLFDLYIDEDIKDFVEEIADDIGDGYPFKHGHAYEWKRMESTKLKNNFNLREVLTKHPNETYEFIKDLDFHKICRKLTIAGPYIQGLKAKSLIRHQLEEFLPDFVSAVLPSLPDLCFDNIMSHMLELSNKDLYNFCKAAVLQEDKPLN